ncbi:MAG: FAD-binding oxidoreductase [Candidatus Paceibacterota bacterium]|jgi:hypothetical protein
MITVSNLLSNVPPLFSSLAKVLSGEINCSYQAITAYSSDGSIYSVRPQAVIYPKNASDIKHVLSFAREYSMPVITRGSGTARSGGSLGEGMILDMTKYFTHIRQINMMDHTITVDAGVSVKTLRDKLRGWNMDVPVLTSQDDGATIGGLISTKSATPTSFHHGTIREWVESLTVVIDTGEEHRIADGTTPSGRLLGIYQAIFPILSESGPVLRATKPNEHDDATGYCLWNTSIGPRQLLDELVGGEGTLGIITSVTLRLAPRKTLSVTTFIPITNSSLLNSCIDISKHHKAEHIFLYDATFTKLSELYHAHLLPKLLDTPYVLCVTHFDTDKEKLHDKLKTFIKAIPVECGSCVQLENEDKIERITEKSYIFSLLDAYTQGSHVANTLADGIIVSVHDYSETLHEIDAYLASTGRLYTITGNAGSGHISVISLFDTNSPTYENELGEYSKNIFTLVKKHKGGISAVGGDGLIRTPFLSYVYNEATMNIFQNIKNAWDPLGILNPGKKISVTTNYLREHLARHLPL